MENLGVAIAFPQKIFSLMRHSIDIVTETKIWSNSEILTWYERFKIWFGNNTVDHEETDYDIARNRANPQVMVELKSIGCDTQLVVASYHMPCLWKRPRSMVIHAGLSCQLAQKFAGGLPLIYCGDFNSTPDSAVYKLITKGCLESNNQHNLKKVMPNDDPWKPDVDPMLSVYLTAMDKEPTYTNHCQTMFDSTPFSAVLDYIFCSDHWVVESVLDLPTSVDKSALLPNEEEPSDHLLIGSTLRIKEEPPRKHSGPKSQLSKSKKSQSVANK